jgi:hypothetical protein
MAWAQRSEAASSAVTESHRFLYKSAVAGPPQRCAGCTRLIAGQGVIVERERYCSIDCVREAGQARDVPGHYLG